MSSSVLYYALGLKNILYQSNRYYGKVAMHGESVVAKSPKKSSPHGSAAFHGGVLRIERVFMYEPPSPWFLFIFYQLMR